MTAVLAPARPPAPDAPVPHEPWPWRVREALMAYLPLLLMLLLALSTWWLVKNAPRPQEPGVAAPLRHDPDYTMERFAVQRFGADGRLVARLEGEQLRHYPDTDTIEIDSVRIRAYGADGRETLATARRAIANGDATEVQLVGGAQVTSLGPQGQPIEFEGEFVHAFLRTEQLRSHLPVVVRQGGDQIRAQAFEYDNLARIVTLKGRVHATFAPRGRR